MDTLHARLRAVFGYEQFRPHQEEIIRALLAGRDCFAVMPTGGGKSLCYQLPACMLEGVCVVVSPLLSLMKDQVDAARGNGIAAASLNSASSAPERAAVWRGLRDGTLKLLYVSPERVGMPDFLDQLAGIPLSFFAIDEAHCISAWGHDFRPDYLGLSVLATAFPQTPIAAFTATATATVSEDITARLGLREPLRVRASFNRANLFYAASPRTDLKRQLVAFLADHGGESGIIYCGSRKDTEKTAAYLSEKGFAARAYHAGLPDAVRASVQEAFRRDECPIIVATIAFGMGIDKPNVRFVVHADLPKNLESYYQETGRAGRDGDAAACLLLYSRQDIARQLGFLEAMDNAQAREAARRQLWRMVDFTRKEGCRRKSLLAYFGETYPEENCGGCDVCVGSVEREDATVPAQKLLSAIVRTGMRFGARHCINIVLGRETDRILACRHNELPTFGVAGQGEERDARYWGRVMDALVVQGMAEIADSSRFPIPVITDAGWQVLRGQASLAIVKEAPTASADGRVRRARPAGTGGIAGTGGTGLAGDTDSGGPEELMARLRAARTELAAAAGVPAFVVFADRTLRQMGRLMPETETAFRSLSGVGNHKWTLYGTHFLAVIAAYLEEHPEDRPAPDETPETGAASGRPKRVRRDRPGQEPGQDQAGQAQTGQERYARGDTWRETGALLEQGLSIADIAARRELRESTVISHLEKLAAAGSDFPPERFIDPARLNYIRKLFYQAGGWRLGPVVELSKTREAEGGEAAVSYEEARLARLFSGAGGAAGAGGRDIADALVMPGKADIDFEPPRIVIKSKPADFD